MEPMTPDAYATAHGTTWDVFAKAGCTWVTRRWKGKDYDAIRFPEGDGARYRLFGAPDKWIPEKSGQSPVLWGLKRAIAIATAAAVPALLLVNGQSSVIPLQAAGVPAFTVPGGEGNIATFLRRGLADEIRAVWQGPVVVMLDGDQQGRKSVDGVLQALRATGTPAWSEDAGDGMDAADYLTLHGRSKVLHVLSATPVSAVSPQSHGLFDTAEQARWRLYTYSDLSRLPPIQWLIERRIIAGGLTLLYGPSGTGKSFRALHYALSVAAAHPDRTVVYIAPEGGQGYHKRATAWSLRNGRPIPDNIVWLLDAPRLDDPEQHAALVALLAPHRPVLVIIDTLARCAVGLDENSARDMGVLINGCDQLRKELAAALPDAIPCGICLVHHTGKSGTGYRGSSALIGAADMAIELTPDGDMVREECAKAKDDKPFEPIMLALKAVPEADSCVMVPATGRVDIFAPLSRNERKVLEILNLAVFQATGAKAKDIQEATGVVKGSVYRLLSNLKERGYLTQHVKGDPYFITDAGSRLVSKSTPDTDAEVSQVSLKSHEVSETFPNPVPKSLSVSLPFRGETERDLGQEGGKDLFDDPEEAEIDADVRRVQARRNGYQAPEGY